MKTPDGDIFFSLGMNGIHEDETYTVVKGREEAFESIPAYEGAYKPAYIRPITAASRSTWRTNTKNRHVPDGQLLLRGSGGTAEKMGLQQRRGLFAEQYGPANKFPYVRMLPIDMNWAKLDGISIFDIFAPGAEAKLDQAFAAAVKPNKNDKLLIGYFMGNEYDFHKFYSDVPKLKASKAAIKGRLVKMLQDKYQKIAAFNASLGDKLRFLQRLAGSRASDQHFGFLAGHGYVLPVLPRHVLRDGIAHLPQIRSESSPARGPLDHDLVPQREVPRRDGGDGKGSIRTSSASTTTPTRSRAICCRSLREIGRQADPHERIRLRHRGAGTGAAAPNAAVNQFQRGMRYRNYVEGVAGLGYVVGAHWFNYVDQAALGRYWQGAGNWAEHYNSGVLNVADRPYKDRS